MYVAPSVSLVLLPLFHPREIWRDLHRPLDVLTHVDRSQSALVRCPTKVLSTRLFRRWHLP